MCGISAIVSFGSASERDLADLSTMHALLAHRGPDGEGVLLVDRSRREELRGDVPRRSPADLVALFAFRRLRIRDLSTRADQPFARRGRRQWILFNGEIYNHDDLRRELGGEFETHSDTEVALAAYERWGNGCFERLTGMWAIVIVDVERGVIVVSRDRLGIKPLAYAFDVDRLLVASEPKAIAAVKKGGAPIDTTRLHRFLSGYPQPAPLVTFFEGVRQVPSATWLEIPIGRPVDALRPQTFWDLRPFTGDDVAVRDDDAGPLFDGLLRDAVRSHLVADVPVGALLSGGLDSSTIARLMSIERKESGGESPKTFSITYSDPAMDESRWIHSMIAQGGLDPTLDQLDPARAFELVDAVVAAQGEPLLGQELIAQYRAFQLAHEHGVMVVLDGQGADELLGGYPFYESVLVRGHLQNLRFIEAAAEVAALARKYERPLARVAASQLWRAARKRKLPSYDWLPNVDAGAADPDQGASGDALNRLLYTQTLKTNLPAVLQYEDRNSMAHSVEARVPFLDHRLVELAFRLPAQWKIHRGDRKRILRRFASGILPADVVARRDKKAFVSTATWLDLRKHPEALGAMIADVATFESTGVQVDRLRRFLSRYVEGGHDDRLAIWRVYTAWRWLKRVAAGNAA